VQIQANKRLWHIVVYEDWLKSTMISVAGSSPNEGSKAVYYLVLYIGMSYRSNSLLSRVTMLSTGCNMKSSVLSSVVGLSGAGFRSYGIIWCTQLLYFFPLASSF
jgi:hypothetical protein